MLSMIVTLFPKRAAKIRTFFILANFFKKNIFLYLYMINKRMETRKLGFMATFGATTGPYKGVVTGLPQKSNRT